MDSTFHPLPLGGARKTGIEVEFAHLAEDAAARTAADTLGGSVEQLDDHDYRVTGSEIGDLKVYLDTALRDKIDGPLAKLGLDLARALVPVEIVTEPLTFDQLPRADALRDALRKAGAVGTGDGLLYGFGLHLNPEIPGKSLGDLLPTLTAYAFLEDLLREEGEMDVSRRVLPFTAPYPDAFLDALARAEDWRMGDLFDAYLDHNPTRNRGLDLLPVLAHLDPDRVARSLGQDATSARPAWHYRLPDCRIDDPDWSIAHDWNRWVTVERIAADEDLLDRLRADRRAHRGLTSDWRARVSDRLSAAGIALPA